MINIFKIINLVDRCKQVFTGVNNPFKKRNKPSVNKPLPKNNATYFPPFKHNQF